MANSFCPKIGSPDGTATIGGTFKMPLPVWRSISTDDAKLKTIRSIVFSSKKYCSSKPECCLLTTSLYFTKTLNSPTTAICSTAAITAKIMGFAKKGKMHGALLLTILFTLSPFLARPAQSWSWNGNTFDENSMLNLALFNEGSGEGSNDEKSLLPIATAAVEEGSTTKEGSAKEMVHSEQIEQELGSTVSFTEKPSTSEEWNRIKQQDGELATQLERHRASSIMKGEKGERGPRGEKGECTKEIFTEIGSPLVQSCSCNISQIVNEYADVFRGLKGDVGPRGPPGANGFPGIPGPPGSGHSRDLSYDTSSNLIDPSLTYMGVREPGPSGPRGLPGQKGNPGHSIKGDKGDRGKRGKTGKPGIRGPIGLPGPKDEVRISDLKRLMLENNIKGVKGDVGPPGPPGPPGPVLHDSWSESRSRHYRGKMYDRVSSGAGETVYIEGPPGPKGEPGLPGATTSSDSVHSSVMVVKDVEELQQATLNHVEGTLAFVLSEQTLLVRNRNGWQYITLGGTLTLPQGMSVPKSNIGEPSVDQSSTALATIATDPSENSRHIAHSKKLRMAALNYPFTGDMHGVRGADYECFRQSRRANLKGTFRAFMAARVQNIDSIVRSKDSKLPVVNLRDEILFNSWRDIFTGAGAPFAYPPKIYSFDGRNIFTDSTWSQKLVWHGADKNGVRNTDAYCDAWGSNAISRMGVASNLVHGKLLDQVKYSCNNQFIVLCVEVSPSDDSSSSRHRRQSAGVHVHN